MNKNARTPDGTPDGTPDESWESEMSREFDHRVRDLNEAPFSLDHVKGKAMTIKRNRRLAVAGSMLAAAAVIVPVAVFSAQQLDGRTDREIPPATSSPAPTQAVDPPSSALAVDYLEGRTWVRPDGSKIELGTRYDGGTMLGANLLATRSDDEGNRAFDVIDQTGDIIETVELVTDLAVNADHTTVAYLEPDGDLMTMWDPAAGDQGRIALTSGLGPNVLPVAVVGGPSCNQAPEGDGCTVYFEYGDAETPPQAATSGGTTDQFVNGPAISVEDVTENGVAAVQQSYSDQGSCNGIYDLEQDAFTWETCDFFLLELNRSGTHIAATHPYLDGIGNGWVAILDTAGNEVVRVDPAEGMTGRQVWEDDDSLLVTVYDQGAWSVWRLNTDGTKEQALSGSRAGNDLNPAYALLAGS
ncbi:MAG: hypothetical protein Q7J48_14595 [Nocardioides sp.]|nr:hypothetical protein [Nocardioides sp.]